MNVNNILRMKNSFIFTLFFTLLFCVGNLLIANNGNAQDEELYEDAVQLDEINIFDGQEGELIDPDWQELEMKIVKLKETIQAITKAVADETESSVLDQQIAEQAEAETQEIASQETETQETESDEIQSKEAVDDDTQAEINDSELSFLDEQTAGQPEAETQEIALQETETQETESDEIQSKEAVDDDTQAETDESESSAIEKQTAEQPEAETQETDSQESELKEATEETTEEATEDEPQGEGVKASDTVELNGDIVEYSIDGNKIIAQGNVIVINKDMDLYCDRIEFSRDTSMAYATGNVRVVMKMGDASEMTGDKLTFNFKTMTGSFDGAHIYAKPYYGYGDKVSKAGENHMQMIDNYITTCKFEKPH